MKTITVKGVGTASVRPDQVQLGFFLASMDLVYEKAMRLASKKLEELYECMEGLGFGREAVKTTNFDVDTEYESEKRSDGNYVRHFCGYKVRHSLGIYFDFDTQRLSEVLGAVAKLLSEPELTVRFAVKDPSAVNDALLASAAENARRKAEVLCAASGAVLGELVSIDYSWGELNVYSHTRYDAMDYLCDCAPSLSMEIEPEEVSARDTATFVWQLVPKNVNNL